VHGSSDISQHSSSGTFKSVELYYRMLTVICSHYCSVDDLYSQLAYL